MGVLSISMPRGDLRKVKFSVKEGDIDRSDLITEISAMTMVGTASLYGFQISFLLG